MENRVAVFVDFENIKRAVDDYFVNERVDLKRIFDAIGEACGGRVVIKRAYADWGAFRDYRSDLLDNATEPVQTFALTYKGKNGADIRMAIDVMDVVLRQVDITHVALVTGDSDFTPLVMKLREFGKFVVGVGVRSNTSNYLAKSCDTFCFYDDLRGGAAGANETPERAFPATPMEPGLLLARALADLGNRAVSGSMLKTQMRRVDPMFDETRHGHTSFFHFLRAHQDVLIDLHKPAIGDLTVAPKGLLAAAQGPGSHEDAAGLSAEEDMSGRGDGYYPASPAVRSAGTTLPLTLGERYRLWLRDNNFRYVPVGERHEVIRVVYDIFSRHEEAPWRDGAAGEGESQPVESISLKEAKDQLHGWFETNRPAVPWESINSTVYHLFYTWCFTFERENGDEGKQLWDRSTRLQADVRCSDDLIARCERGIVRKLWERDRNDLDAAALNEWLNDGDPSAVPAVEELICGVVVAPVVPGGGANGYPPGPPAAAVPVAVALPAGADSK